MNDGLGWVDTARAPLVPEAPPTPPVPGQGWGRGWRGPLALALVCGLGATLSLFLSRQPGSVASVWYANAPAVAVLMRAAPRRWPALLLASALGIGAANLLAGDGLWRAASFLPANLAEMALAAWLLRRTGAPDARLRTPRELLRLLLVGGVLPQLLGALLGAFTVVAQGGVDQLGVARHWFQGSVIGTLSLLPLSVLLLERPPQAWRAELLNGHMAWLVPLSSGTALLCLAQLPFPFVYLLLPLLVSAMRVEFLAVSLLTFLASVTVTSALALGVFVPPPVTAEWQHVFVYLAFAAALLPAQLLAAALAELRDSHDRLAARTEQLSRANDGLEQFVRIASHDLREPLNTVVQFTGLVMDDHRERLPEDARHYLALVNRAASRMRLLLDDVLQYTRLQRGDWPSPAPVPLDAVLAEVRQSVAGRLMDGRGLLQVGPLPVVQGHAPLLTLLFQNLVANALKFVPPGRRPEVTVTGRTDGDMAELTVADNGIGIDAEDLPKLFKPFQRLNLRRVYEGSGLGLALCRRIAAVHGGSIEVSSVRGEGSRFTVRLPLA